MVLDGREEVVRRFALRPRSIGGVFESAERPDSLFRRELVERRLIPERSTRNTESRLFDGFEANHRNATRFVAVDFNHLPN